MLGLKKIISVVIQRLLLAKTYTKWVPLKLNMDKDNFEAS